MRRASRATLAVLPALAVAVAVLGAWELYVDLGGVDPFLLPAPHSVAAALWGNAEYLWLNFTVTAEEVVLGLALSLAAGFLAAIVIHLSPLARRALYPHAVGSQAIPIAVFAPMLAFWWGFGLFPKLLVIALICFFPIVVTTVDALASVDPDQLKLMRTLEASRLRAFRLAELPSALPGALSGARIALAVGVIGAYIAESQTPTSGAYAGLGREINADLWGGDQTARAYAAAVVLFLFAIVCFYSLGLAERRLAPWTQRHRGEHR